MLRPASRATRSGELVDRLIDLAIMAGLVVLILVGFTTSYRTLLDLAVTAGGYPRWLAPAVPLSFDLGIVVLSLKVARSAREGRTAPVMRLLVVALSAATVLANASAASTLPAKLLHAVPPAMFVVCFESVIVSARRHALLMQDLLPPSLPKLRAAQWVLAPATTWGVWRKRVLSMPGELSPHALTNGDSEATRFGPASIHSAIEARPTSPLQLIPSRSSLLNEIMSAEPTIAAPALRSKLADRGHAVSLRTVQRLLATARDAQRS